MSKLKINLEIEVVAIAICPVVQSKFRLENELQTAEPLKTLIKIDAFNEMIELYNEKHKDDDKIMLSDNEFNSAQDIIDKINYEKRK